MNTILGYQSNITGGVKTIGNTQKFLSILPAHLSDSLKHSLIRNVYSVINDNLVVGKDIRLSSANGKDEVTGWMLSLPAPLVIDKGDYTGTLLSSMGAPFFYTIDAAGRVFLQGKFKDRNDEVILNINPYLAELPLRITPFPRRRVKIRR